MGNLSLRIPSSATRERSWTRARDLPTEVHLDLKHQGKISDPFIDLNEIPARWVAEYDWVYRTTFETPTVEEG